jgi:para-nitrobenzyl esterase
MTDPAVVQTDAGPVRGAVTDGHRLFHGIPYAASTAGERRWRPPQPAPPWTQARDATRPGPMCPQQPSSYAQVASVAEDCLCLNVTAPRAAGPRQPRPVMVWIHGDGAIGAGSFFDARRLATVGDVVVVTINYRLGIFGAFGHPGLQASGAFGLQDQQAALRWVARNAAAFGGDPGNVTVFGESYGGLSASAHLVAPGSAGLFHRAIVQSGFALMDLPAGGIFPGLPAVAWYGWRSSAEVEALGAAVAPQLGCADAATALACLRGVPVPELFAHAQPFQPYGFGNRVLPEVPAQALADGRFHRVPVISGGTRDEHRLFVGLFRALAGQPVTARQYPTLLAEAFGEHAGEVRARYPLSAYPSPNLAWATVLTDRMWARSISSAAPAARPAGAGLRLRVRRPSRADVPAVPRGPPARRLPRRRGPLPVPRPAVPGGQHPRAAAPVRAADALLGQLRPHRRPQRSRPAAMAPLRRRPAGAERAVPGPRARWHRPGRLRRRAPAGLLVRAALGRRRRQAIGP